MTEDCAGARRGQQACACPPMLCIVPAWEKSAVGVRHAAELTTKARRQKTATRLESVCLILYLLDVPAVKPLHPADTVYQRGLR